MTSSALSEWRTSRAAKIERLLTTHKAIGGSTPGGRWATEELNHAIILRLASEFQGFCRDLHDEAVRVVVSAFIPARPEIRLLVSVPYRAARRLNRGNAEPGSLGSDFGLLGMNLWPDLKVRYPSKADGWRRGLELLNEARNGIAHSDVSKIRRVEEAGWPVT